MGTKVLLLPKTSSKGFKTKDASPCRGYFLISTEDLQSTKTWTTSCLLVETSSTKRMWCWDSWLLKVRKVFRMHARAFHFSGLPWTCPVARTVSRETGTDQRYGLIRCLHTVLCARSGISSRASPAKRAFPLSTIFPFVIHRFTWTSTLLANHRQS